jgi:hypothetical protein
MMQGPVLEVLDWEPRWRFAVANEPWQSAKDQPVRGQLFGALYEPRCTRALRCQPVLHWPARTPRDTVDVNQKVYKLSKARGPTLAEIDVLGLHDPERRFIRL